MNMDAVIRKRKGLVQKAAEQRRKFKDDSKSEKERRDDELTEQVSLSIKDVFTTILEEKGLFTSLQQIQEGQGTLKEQVDNLAKRFEKSQQLKS
jgi:hypothetical protein